MDPPRRAALAMIALALAALVAGLARAWPDTIDDAHITFRYAENAAAGRGLVYNPGGARVEGYSNPLLLFALIPAARAGIAPETAARALGLAGFALCVAAAWGLAGALGGGRLERLAAGALTAGHFPLLYYSATGLETGLFAGLLAAALWRHLAREHGGSEDGAKPAGIDIAGAALWLAVALSRPEGILYPLALGVWETSRMAIMARETGVKHITWRLYYGRVATFAITGAGFALFLLWRHEVFGRWTPNTFTAKPPGTAGLTPAEAGWKASLLYASAFLLQMGLALPLFAAMAAWAPGIRKSDGWRSRLTACYLVLACGILFGLYTGGDWMPSGRYLLPVFVPWAVLGLRGLAAALEVARAREVRASVRQLGAVVVVAAAFAVPWAHLAEFHALREMYPYHVMNSVTCAEAGKKLRERYGTEKKLVCHRIGAVGRFSGMEILDLFGLVDAQIAEIVARNPQYHPNTRQGDDVPELRDYLRARRPDLLLCLSPKPIVGSKGFTLYGYRFRHAASIQLGRDQYWELYERIP